jgi:hypothetical protein
VRRGILFSRGACAGTERQTRRSGRRVEAQRERRLRSELALSSSIRAARGTKMFSKMTVLFSTHCIEVFASIYG